MLAGRRVPYSCENKRFRTNVNIGRRHGAALTRGSVTGDALIGSGGYTLWLEHVEEIGDPQAEWYWLMWYDPSGVPTVPLSSVFTRAQLADMVRELMQFVP